MARLTLTVPGLWVLWLSLFSALSMASAPNRTDTILWGSKASMLPTATSTFYGSVMATDATATTYAITCPKCAVTDPVTVTEGPSTLKFGNWETIPIPEGLNGTASSQVWWIQGECQVEPTDATCTHGEYAKGSRSDYDPVTRTLERTEMNYIAVTVTAGAGLASPTTGGARGREDMASAVVGLAAMVAGAFFVW